MLFNALAYFPFYMDVYLNFTNLEDVKLEHS